MQGGTFLLLLIPFLHIFQNFEKNPVSFLLNPISRCDYNLVLFYNRFPILHFVQAAFNRTNSHYYFLLLLYKFLKHQKKYFCYHIFIIFYLIIKIDVGILYKQQFICCAKIKERSVNYEYR